MRAWLQTHGRALLLLPWIGFILGLLISGAYTEYVARWHIYLQITALGLLGFTFAGEVIRARLARAGGDLPGQHCGHEHHSHGAPVRPALVLAHLAPMLVFLAVGPLQLGLDPDLDRPTDVANLGQLGNPEKASTPYTQDGYEKTDLLRLHQGYADKKELPQKVWLLGQYYSLSDEELSKDTTGLKEKGVKSYLFRYLMVCCAADARPLAVGLLTDKPLELGRQAWVEVKGRPVILQGDKPFMALKLHHIKQVPKPKLPYIYALF